MKKMQRRLPGISTRTRGKRRLVLPLLIALLLAALAAVPAFAETGDGSRDLTLLDGTESAAAGLDAGSSAAADPSVGQDPGTYQTAANGYAYTAPTVADNTLRVYDFAGILGDSDEASITARIRKVEQSKDCTIVVVTTQNVAEDPNYGTDRTRAYAEDFYDANASGFRNDAFVLCIDMNNRVLYTVGHGKYADKKYVSFEKKVYDNIYAKAREGDYAGAARAFVEDVYKLENWRYALIPTAGSLLISLAAGLIAAFILIASHKSAEPSAHNVPAVELGKPQVLRHDVRQTGKFVTSHRIVRNNDSGGHGGGGFSGGTHTSGGGGHFSGGGGHF